MPLNPATLDKIVMALLLSVFFTACTGGGGRLPPNNACGSLLPGDNCVSIEFPADSGEFRHFILHVPAPPSPSPSSDDTAKPLLIALHGAGYHANEFNDLFRFDSLSNSYGYIVATAESTARPTDGNKVWNTQGADRIPNVDDVGFILAIIDKLSAEYAIDMDGINLFGWSNGGFMSSRLACEHPEIFASMFTFAGHIRQDLTECSSAGSVAVSYLHGTSDTLVPYDGGEGRYLPSTYAIEQWAQKNACTLDLVHRESYDFTPDLSGEETELLEYHDCAAPVQHLEVNGGGHVPNGFNFATFHRVVHDFMKSAKPAGVANRE